MLNQPGREQVGLVQGDYERKVHIQTRRSPVGNSAVKVVVVEQQLSQTFEAADFLGNEARKMIEREVDRSQLVKVADAARNLTADIVRVHDEFGEEAEVGNGAGNCS